MTLISVATFILSSLTLLGQAVIFVLIISFFFPKHKVFRFLENKAVFFAFVVALTATLGSLFFSEIAGYTPCKLCWFQRIFMYPQVVILGMAFFKNNGSIVNYSLALSVIGSFFSLYNYLMQVGSVSFLPCSEFGDLISCSRRYVFHFGYITISMMALTAFLMIILFMLKLKKGQNLNKE